MKKLKKVLLFFLVLSFLFYVYDKTHFQKIEAKQSKEHIRIGYINLHESKISKEDIIKLETYNCDLWLFLEWNGNNLNNHIEFEDGYNCVYEAQNTNSFGLYVLSKDSTATVKEIDNKQRPYACDYPKNLITYKSINIYLAHAPPPIPSCDFETNKYILDLLVAIKPTTGNSNILIGDFNTLPFQSAIKKIKKSGFKDSYGMLNSSPIGTYGPTIWSPKIIKIDYVFHKGKLKPMDIKRFSICTSDHSGWIADFKLL